VTSGEQDPWSEAELEDELAGFRSKRGQAVAHFASAQAGIIRSLVGQVAELVSGGESLAGAAGADQVTGRGQAPGAGSGSGTDSGTGTYSGSGTDSGSGTESGTGSGSGSGEDDLAALLGLSDNSELPADPILARLLPDAYADDPEASGEFRRYTEVSLRSGKAAAAQTVLDTLPASGGKVTLGEEDAQAWLRALNDVRLALGVVLDVTDEFDDEMEALPPDDPRAAYVGVYQWLGYLQQTLVEALD
jgi:hypothetical protein